MKFKLVENLSEAILLHWGNLDKGIKADKRSIMVGRGTGHFGTGFYFINADNPKYGLNTDYKYSDREDVWELDSSSYNLYKPRSNNDAYTLHDQLKELNNLNDFSLNGEEISKNLKSDVEELSDYLYDNYFSINDKDREITDDDISQMYLKLIKKYNIDKYLADWDLQEAVKNNQYGLLEDWIYEAIEDADKDGYHFTLALTDLSYRFHKPKDELLQIIKQAYNDKNNEDSISTMFMKALRYEGIDVSHLMSDAQGLSGLDNFKYGTVIYDLKPGTYKKIR